MSDGQNSADLLPMGDSTQDSLDDKVQPAIPGMQLNIGSIEQNQQEQPAQQAEGLGTDFMQPAADGPGPPVETVAPADVEVAAAPAAQTAPAAAEAALPAAAVAPVDAVAAAAGAAGFPGAVPAGIQQLPMPSPGAQPLNLQQQQQQQMLMQQLFLQQQQQQVQAALASGQQMTPQQLQALQVMMLLQRNQALLQQQQLMGRQGTAGGGSPFLSGLPTAGMARVPGEQPPAKRQAMDAAAINHQAQIVAAQQFRQLHASGNISNMNQSQQQALFQTLYTRARNTLGMAGASGSAPSRGGMRVAIDRRNRTGLDKMFNAEDTTDKDHADEVVRRCEEISKSLRSHLGKGIRGGGAGGEGRFGGTDVSAAEGYQQVSQKDLMDACGDSARFLKPYQIVGVNFLTLLYRTQIGGAILADEMGLGKTAQLICYLGAIRALANDPGPHLVVVPASLLENWQRELRRWCPALKSVVYYGKHRSIVRKRLSDLREKLERGEEVEDDLEDLQDSDVLAEAAASERVAEAAAAADELANDDDPLGVHIVHESDDEYDLKRDKAPQGSVAAMPPEPPPPKWDFNAKLAPAPFNVMLTSYTLFERDSPDQRADREFLEGWRWSHLIMDEAHALKNRNAQRTTRLRRVANASRRRIMMTGTPLQNDLMELQNLMHFLLPQVFAAQGFEDFAVMLQGDDKEVKRLTDRMKQLLGPFVLRRLKTEVAGQLTEKKHVTEFIEMTPEQDSMYQASVESMRSQLTAKAAAKAVAEGESGAVEKFVKSLGAKKINHMFTHLRKIAQHPLLIRHQYDDATVELIARKAFDAQLFGGNATIRRVTEELMGYSDYSLHAFCYNSGPDFASHRLNSTHLLTSTKFRFLQDLLPKLKKANSRPLIFSQWTAVLDVIEWLMEELRLPYVRLDGSTAVEDRLATVDRFNNSHEDVFAFLLSTRAGGQGLNLTGADTVILHDVDFNPQIDRQAEDRCHRLGQTKPVMVYRLITKGSVDQNIYNLSQRKLKLDAAVLDGIVTGRGARQKEAAQERQQMGFILHSLFAGKEDYEAMIAGAMADDEETKRKEEDQRKQAEEKEVKDEEEKKRKREKEDVEGGDGAEGSGSGAVKNEEVKEEEIKEEETAPAAAAADGIDEPAAAVEAKPEENGDIAMAFEPAEEPLVEFPPAAAAVVEEEAVAVPASEEPPAAAEPAAVAELAAAAEPIPEPIAASLEDVSMPMDTAEPMDFLAASPEVPVVEQGVAMEEVPAAAAAEDAVPAAPAAFPEAAALPE